MSATRSRPVAQSGATFSSARAPVSKETQELLKVMMRESKLTNFQQRQLKNTMRTGGSLPLTCNPTTSNPGRRGQEKEGSKSSRQPSVQGIRTKQTIERMVDTEPDYRPSPSKFNSSVEKQRLQNVMAFGTDIESKSFSKASSMGENLPTQRDEVDRFDEILQEITERKEFLDEMEALGQGQKYRSKIMTEISQKIHELELLDKQRCKEFTSTFNS